MEKFSDNDRSDASKVNSTWRWERRKSGVGSHMLWTEPLRGFIRHRAHLRDGRREALEELFVSNVNTNNRALTLSASPLT